MYREDRLGCSDVFEIGAVVLYVCDKDDGYRTMGDI